MKAKQTDPKTPFQTRIRRRWMPRGLIDPPILDPDAPRSAIKPWSILLINPFYPKDPHGSFGKHDLVHTVWNPLVELNRRGHLRLRKRLAVRRGTDPPRIPALVMGTSRWHPCRDD